MLALTAPTAALVWFVFHDVYTDLSVSERAVGYVDPMMQAGITLGYYAMIGGTLALAAFAIWSILHILALLLKRRR